MSIEFQNVTRRFGDTVALDDVSLTVQPGQIYGLLGNNGAGKTTLLSILTDRLPSSSGQVLVDGESVRGNDAALGKLFLVGEQNLFPEDMRVRRALDVAGQFYPDFDHARAEEIAGKFGLELKKKIRSLSTGYASIFRLVLGLSVNAPYLLFDEPVLGLDARHRDLFYRLLTEKFAEGGCTVLLSTHLIAEAAPLVNHTLILHRGRVLRDAPTETLTAGVRSVSGPADAVDAYAEGKRVLSARCLGGLKTVCLEGAGDDTLPTGLESRPVDLQDYFISLMEKEENQ